MSTPMNKSQYTDPH